MIQGIFAVDEKLGMGKNGDLPWPRNSADLSHFKEQTLDTILLMGRKTFESLSAPLPFRAHIVATKSNSNVHHTITSNPRHYVEDAILNGDDVSVIGGPAILTEVFDLLDQVLITRIAGEYDADVVFNNLPELLSVNKYSKAHEFSLDNNAFVECWISNKETIDLDFAEDEFAAIAQAAALRGISVHQFIVDVVEHEVEKLKESESDAE